MKSIGESKNTFVTAVVLLLSIVLFFTTSEKDVLYLSFFLFACVFLFFALKVKLTRNIEKVIGYTFIFTLLFIILTQIILFFNNSFSKEVLTLYLKFKSHLFILATAFGITTFYFNKEKSKIYADTRKSDLMDPQIKQVSANNFLLIKKIITWFYLDGKKYSISLILLIIFGGVFRAVSAIWGNTNLDEGIHIYDAKLIIDGLIPFKDYFTREPYYIYLLSGFVKLFGANLFASRLLSVIASTLTIPIVYFLGRNIFSKKIGLISATLFSLSPFVIYNTSLGNLYGVYPFVLGAVFLAFHYLLENSKTKNLIITGVLLGMAAHFYRLTIFYFPVIGLIWGLSLYKKMGVKSFLLFYSMVALPFFLPLIYFSTQSGYKNFEIIYGTNELIIAFLSIPVGLICGVIFNKFVKKLIPHKQDIVAFLLLSLFAAAVYSFFNIGIAKQLKAKIFFDAVLQSWHFIFFIFIFLIIYLKKEYLANNKLTFLFKLLFLGSFLYLAVYGTITSQALQNFGARIMPLYLKDFFLLFFTLSIAFLFSLNKKINNKSLFFNQNIVYWWLLFFTPLCFYLIHVQLFASVFLSFIVLGSILSACGFSYLFEIYKSANQVIKLFLVIMVVSFLFFPTYTYVNVPLRDRVWSSETQKSVIDYIEKNTSEDEEIFSNALVFVLEANRRSVLDQSRSSIYAVNPVKMPAYIGTAKNLVPSKDLAKYVKNNINLILIDSRTKQIFKTNTDFSNVLDDYHLDKKWREGPIEAWKKNNN
jgi:4-amino-4-deoxy-L-arabinose transferase-like glycosyltransferase